jgi:hypothetical protein
MYSIVIILPLRLYIGATTAIYELRSSCELHMNVIQCIENIISPTHLVACIPRMPEQASQYIATLLSFDNLPRLRSAKIIRTHCTFDLFNALHRAGL